MSSKILGVMLLCLGLTGRAMAQEDVSADAKADEAAPLAAAPTPAPEPATPFVVDAGPLPIEFHGYASQGYVVSDHNNYFAYNTNKGSFRMTEVALNATSQITDRLRVVLQVASVLNDDLNQPLMRLDFGFVDYRLSDALGFRLGRFRMLSTLYTEVWDTDIARTPIFLPQSVYDPLGRLFFMNANGAQVYGALRSQHAGQVDYVVSVGTLLPFALQGTTIDVPLVNAGRVTYTTPFSGLRFGANWNLSEVKATLPSLVTQGLMAAGALPANYAGNVTVDYHKFYRAGVFAELSLGGWMLAAEYLRMAGDASVSPAAVAALVPAAPLRQDGGYLMTSYRFTDWVTAGAYASFSWPDYRFRNNGPATHMYDYAATLRFDINSYLAFKTEVHRIIGTGGLNTDLNPTTTANNGWLFATRISAAF